MTLTTRNGLIAAMAAGVNTRFNKTNYASVNVGGFWTHFRNSGMPTGPASFPASTGVQCDRTSPGALPIPAPSGVSYITSFEATSSQPQTLLLADRLVEFGGLVANVTTPQTVSALALPARATGALDVELWIEMYVAGGGSTSLSVTASYTNQSGTAGRTATVIGGIQGNSWQIARGYQFALQAGDTGVQSVQSVTLGTSSGTAGNLGLVLRRTLLGAPILLGGTGVTMGWAETGLRICPDDACLELISLIGGSGSGSILGTLGISQA